MIKLSSRHHLPSRRSVLKALIAAPLLGFVPADSDSRYWVRVGIRNKFGPVIFWSDPKHLTRSEIESWQVATYIIGRIR